MTVAKESADNSVNNAERRGDSWNFGGIYRPVTLQAFPASRILRSAVNAQASGVFTPAVGPTPVSPTVEYPAGGISFLDGIPAIGNKFHSATSLGPESQPVVATGDYHRSVYFRFTA